MTQLPVGPSASDGAARWRAVRDRDAAADGAFYVLNRQTGVYCRPSCPSKRGRVEHLQLIARLAEVGAGGVRPCARCTPDRVTGRERALALALHLLDTGVPAPGLTELARAAGLSPSHLQRVFTRALGLSPKHYALGVRAGRFKALLRAGAGVTEAMYAAGYPSPRTLYDRATDQLGMRPGAYRRGGAGETIRYTLADAGATRLRLLLARTARGLCSVQLGDDAALIRALRDEYPGAWLLRDDAGLRPEAGQLARDLARRRRWHTEQDDAWRERGRETLRALPAENRPRYAKLADQLGLPDPQAVARICAALPLAVNPGRPALYSVLQLAA